MQTYLNKVKKELDNLNLNKVQKIADVIKEADNIYIFGNGGSAATASHFACDLNNAGYKARSLNDNMSVITAYANDIYYPAIFEEQVKLFVKPEDVVIGISASGNSANVLRGIRAANSLDAKTIGFVGFGGGKLKPMVDYDITLKSKNYGVVEDVHLMLEHMICDYLRK